MKFNRARKSEWIVSPISKTVAFDCDHLIATNNDFKYLNAFIFSMNFYYGWNVKWVHSHFWVHVFFHDDLLNDGSFSSLDLDR